MCFRQTTEEGDDETPPLNETRDAVPDPARDQSEEVYQSSDTDTESNQDHPDSEEEVRGSVPYTGGI